jgi:hypothetical protein
MAITMPQGLDDRSPGPQSTSLRIAAMQRHKDVADPAGARRMEELRGHPGNLLLVPPRGKLPGVNAGTSDFIGIYTSVAPPNGCKDGVAPGVLATPAGFRSWAKRQQGFGIRSSSACRSAACPASWPTCASRAAGPRPAAIPAACRCNR